MEAKVETAFKDFTQQPYNLHAILVHDGSAESGHYFSFIYSHEHKSWFKFNDHLVTEVTEDRVMQDSMGGQQNSHKAAYLLVYTNQFVSQSRVPSQKLVEMIPKQVRTFCEDQNS